MHTEDALYNALKYRVTVSPTGTRRYYNALGQLHREDGPAIEYSTGGRVWYQNGLLHRADGPAVDRASGTKQWWLNGQQYTEHAYCQLINVPETLYGH